MLGKRTSLLATHNAIDQRKIDRLARKKDPRPFRRECGGHSMAECCEKLRYHRLNVCIVFNDKDMRHVS